MRCSIPLSLSLLLALSAAATARPGAPAWKLAVSIPATTQALADFPVTLSFHFDDDGERRFTPDSLAFILLAEDGAQVAIDPFIPIDTPNQTVLKGREPVYPLKLRWDPYRAGDTPAGKKYQLVCTWTSPVGVIASSAWFTLSKDK